LKKVAIIYLKSRFFIDLISAVPMDQVALLFIPPDQASEF